MLESQSIIIQSSSSKTNSVVSYTLFIVFGDRSQYTAGDYCQCLTLQLLYSTNHHA